MEVPLHRSVCILCDIPINFGSYPKTLGCEARPKAEHTGWKLHHILFLFHILLYVIAIKRPLKERCAMNSILWQPNEVIEISLVHN